MRLLGLWMGCVSVACGAAEDAALADTLGSDTPVTAVDTLDGELAGDAMADDDRGPLDEVAPGADAVAELVDVTPADAMDVAAPDTASPDAADMDMADPDVAEPDVGSDVAVSPEWWPTPDPDLVELAPGVTVNDVAMRFSPAFHHDMAQGGPDGLGPKADWPTNVDYDGNFQHNDNWNNLPAVDVAAYFYYALVATETHYFLTFSEYHPRDWEQFCSGLFTECHEGDMETVRIVVRRDDAGFGTVMLVQTGAHGSSRYWRPADAAVAKGPESGFDGGIDFEDDAGGFSAVQTVTHTHARILIQSKGHGPIACIAGPEGTFDIGFIEGVHCGGEAPYDEGFLGDDGVVFRVGAPQAYQLGLDTVAQAASYGLLSYRDTLFVHRYDVGDGKLFRSASAFVYEGARGHPYLSVAKIGAQYDSKEFLNDLSGGSAGWNHSFEGSNEGDVFFDPAHAFNAGFVWEPPFSLVYTYNPYVDPVTGL